MPVVSLALRDLRHRWRMVLALATMIVLTVATVTLLDGYVHSIGVRFRSSQPRLVVQQDSTVGEFAGSQLAAGVGDQLRAMGYDDPVAEVHAVTGTSGSDAVLIAGVDPDRYDELDPYHVRAGRGLRSGEDRRTAIVGTFLADRLHVGAGDTIRLRGRDFAVVGVFELGTYLDDAAVVPIADAQRLLGWGDDVSVFVIPAAGPLSAGDTLPGGLVVANRGDVALVAEWSPLLALLTASVRLLAVGVVAVLAIALWRLAWLHRLDLGLLRLMGFRRRAVVAFLATQAVVLVVAGAALGAATAVVVAPRLARTTLAVTTMPVVDAAVLGRAALYGLLVLVLALSVSLLAVLRRGVGDLVHRND